MKLTRQQKEDVGLLISVAEQMDTEAVADQLEAMGNTYEELKAAINRLTRLCEK